MTSYVRMGRGEGNEDGRTARDTEGTLWSETHQDEDKVDWDPVCILQHSRGGCSPVCPEGWGRDCSGSLMLCMRTGTFTGDGDSCRD